MIITIKIKTIILRIITITVMMMIFTIMIKINIVTLICNDIIIGSTTHMIYMITIVMITYFFNPFCCYSYWFLLLSNMYAFGSLDSDFDDFV